MNTLNAKKIGSKEALKAVIAGIIIAYLIMTWLSDGFAFLHALTWIKNIDYKFNLIVGGIAILLAGHYFGQHAGAEILINRKNKYWTGIKYGLLTVLTATVSGSLVGVLQNIGIDDNVFFDYIVKPLFWVMLFGILPIIIVGLWFGISIKMHDKRDNPTGS
jgi:hypothetical protein